MINVYYVFSLYTRLRLFRRIFYGFFITGEHIIYDRLHDRLKIFNSEKNMNICILNSSYN